jgi:1-acyl-sn-glycerol-3-phosphate acyltransferase
MTSSGFNLYIAIRSVLRLALGFYFRRIERFHPERVPEQGPVLFTSNHPNSITDSFIIGISVAICRMPYRRSRRRKMTFRTIGFP